MKNIFNKIFHKYQYRVKKIKKIERQEFNKFISGKESFFKFFKKSLHALKDFFIPHQGNNHKPHSVRSKALFAYLIFAILVKFTATGLLYIIYPTPGQMSEIVASKMFELTNTSRKANNLSTLRPDPILTRAAEAKGKDMIKKEYFAHDTPEGKRPWQWIEKDEYDYVYAGENLAMGFTSAEMVQEAFMNSPTHKKNILNSQYQDVGLAVVSGKMNGKLTDVLVVMFGTKRSAQAAAEGKKVVSQTKPQPKPQPQPQITPVIIPSGTDVATSKTPIDAYPNTELNTEISGARYIKGDEIQPTGHGDGVLFVVVRGSSGRSISDTVIDLTNIIFIAFIIFIVVALILNIFIKIRIQHYNLIVQTIAVLAFITALVLTKLHFIEKIAPQLLIL